MIEPHQCRLDEFEKLDEPRDTLHRGYLDTEQGNKDKINGDECKWIPRQACGKIEQMIEFCNNNKIDVAMLSETNGKWTTRTADKMSSRMKELGR